MSKPAARMGDMTAHGGSIIVGFPTVLIGGQPAARLGDMHVCPMVTPGLPPIPHVGGPITLGSSGVLIGGQPAARMGDMATCVGPPDVISIGCPTVLIGESMPGGGGGGGGGGDSGTSALTGARSSVVIALLGKPGGKEVPTKEGHWLQFDFVDTGDKPVSGIRYELTAPDGEKSTSILGGDGRVYWSGEQAGEGTVKLMCISNARWSQQSAQVGDAVTLTADVAGYDSGTPAQFRIYERDVKGTDKLIATIEAETQGDEVEAEWKYEYPVEWREEEELAYSSPEYYFDVFVEQTRARSGLLEYKDYVEIELRDEENNPVPDREYILYISNGEVRKGTLDGNGYKREEDIPPRQCKVRFPGISADTQQR